MFGHMLEAAIETAVYAGRLYTIGLSGVLSGNNGQLVLFNNSTARTFVVLAASAVNISASHTNQLNMIVTDPGITAAPISSSVPGGPTSLATAEMVLTGGANAGTFKKIVAVSLNGGTIQGRFITSPFEYIILPQAQANGINILITGANTEKVSGEIVWVEL
jgi:hypothetical protein